jgi:large subunit ribosomal protein L4
MDLQKIDVQGQSTGSVAASDQLFGREYNEALVHQLVTAFQANARFGNRAQKDRGEVKHTTHKPFKQKGTGRARAGMSSSPLWRGGGRIFPNRPDENFSQKVNRKMFRAGIATILSQLARDGRLRVIDAIEMSAPKTKELLGKIKAMGVDKSRVLIIDNEVADNLWLSSRNLENVLVTEPRYADPVTLVHFDQILVTQAAIKGFEEIYA